MQTLVNTAEGAKLFILRALKNPRQLGAVAPSSRYLGALFARYAIVDQESPIVELGGGTGSITRALLKAGVAPERLYVIELDPVLADYLKLTLPQVNVIQGNAAELAKILPPEILGKVRRVVSGLPLTNIPKSIQHQILDSSFEVLASDGAYLQYTYTLGSPIDAKACRVKKKRLGTIFLNIPPATIWQYLREK